MNVKCRVVSGFHSPDGGVGGRVAAGVRALHGRGVSVAAAPTAAGVPLAAGRAATPRPQEPARWRRQTREQEGPHRILSGGYQLVD